MSALRKKTYPPLSMRENMLWNSAGSITYLACQWLVTVLIVRLSDGYNAAGLLSLASSVTGTFGTFANYKMGVYQISDIKHENTTSEYLGFRLITLGGSFIACIIYSLITCPLSSILTITLYFIFKAVGLVIDIMHGLDQVNRRMDFIGKSFILQGVSTLAAFTVVFGLTQSLDLAIMAMTAAAFGVLFLFDLPHSRTFESYGVHITAKKTFYLLKRSFSAVLASLACSAIYTAPKQLLLVMVSDAALGIYSSAAAPALVVQMGATYLYAPLLDVFARHHYERNKQEMLRLLKRTALGVIAIGIVCYIGAGLLALRREHPSLCLLAATRGGHLGRHSVPLVLRRPTSRSTQLQRLFPRQRHRPCLRRALGCLLHTAMGHERRELRRNSCQLYRSSHHGPVSCNDNQRVARKASEKPALEHKCDTVRAPLYPQSLSMILLSLTPYCVSIAHLPAKSATYGATPR